MMITRKIIAVAKSSKMKNNDDDAGYILMNGEKVYEGPIDEDDVVFVELEHNIKEYSSLQERIDA